MDEEYKTKIIEIARQDTVCPICRDYLTEPRQLTLCSHVICQSCLCEHVQRSTKNYPPCPVCKKPIDKKKVLENKLPVALLHRNIADVIKRAFSTRTDLIIRQPQDVTVHRNKHFTLSVHAHRDSHVQHDWYRNGQRLDVSSDTIRVEQAGEKDFGEYFCIVSDRTGLQRSNIVKVEELKSAIEFYCGIQLLEEPRDQSLQIGSQATLICRAKCTEPLLYRWYKDDKVIEDATNPILTRFGVTKYRDEGTYHCQIRKENDVDCTFSTKAAMITVDGFQPKGKVAILMFSQDGLNPDDHRGLAETITEAGKISKSLRALGFKVCSCLNFSQTEMESTINEICKYLGDYAYVLFYFHGSGEITETDIFMRPYVDTAGWHGNRDVSVKDTLQKLSTKKPALICCMLDIYQPLQKYEGSHLGKSPQIRDIAPGNTAILFARHTELSDAEHSTFCLQKYFVPLMNKTNLIEDMLSDVKRGFCWDVQQQGKSNKHVVDLYSNIRKHYHCLTDKVSRSQNEEEDDETPLKHLTVPYVPASRDCSFSDLEVIIELSFQSDVSNVLHVTTKVKSTGSTATCECFIKDLPLTISEVVILPEETDIGQTLMSSTTALVGLQELQSDLTFNIDLKYMLPGDDSVYIQTSCGQINLPKPPLAQMLQLAISRKNSSS